jgi:hypothetical protein
MKFQLAVLKGRSVVIRVGVRGGGRKSVCLPREIVLGEVEVSSEHLGKSSYIAKNAFIA